MGAAGIDSARCDDRNGERRAPRRLAHGSRNDLDLRKVVEPHRGGERPRDLRHRLEGEDPAGGADGARQGQRPLSEIGSDVDCERARPQERERRGMRLRGP